MLTLLAALAVSALIVGATFPDLLTALVSRPSSPPAAEAGLSLAGGGNPWPAVPALAAGPRLYDHDRAASWGT